MKVSDDLFKLIHSLEKQEKRYFKLFIGMSGIGLKKNMLDLFDEIERQKVYDEAKIRKKFKSKTFIKQLHVSKNRLYNAILKSLHAYHSEQSAEGKLYRMIHKAEILYGKGLHKQSKKLLNKAKKEALTNEHFLYVLQILQLEVLYFGQITKVEQLKSQSLEGYQIGLKIIERYRNFMEYNMMRTKIIEFAAKRNAGENLKIKVEELFEERELKLLESEDTALSFTALQLQLIINSIYSRFKGEMTDSLFYRNRFVEIFEQNDSQLIGNSKAYITGLNNLFAIQHSLKHFKDAIRTIKKLENLKKGTYFKLTDQRNLDIILRAMSGRLSIYLETNNIEVAIEYVNEVKPVIEDNYDAMPQNYQLIFCFYIAVIYFIQSDNQNATSWFYKILNHPAVDSNKEIHTYSRMLNLLCYFAMDNESLFNSFYKSTERYIKNKKLKLKFIKYTMRHLRTLNKTVGKKELNNKWTLFKEDISSLMNDKKEMEGIANLKLIEWIDCKISGEQLYLELNNKKLNIF